MIECEIWINIKIMRKSLKQFVEYLIFFTNE